ncbi:MAG: exopolysaccharide biosynthesis protein [Inquilinus sp.]|uniref:exopolysaccharide biosynthesis protein n=1 Tax=Inquilinus sp. TaxID=1932117 RepID=UPI003F31A55B
MPDAHQTETQHPDPGTALPTGPKRRRRFSEVLQDLAAEGGERIAIADILTAFGDRAFGALMLVFAAPNILPTPPGTSSVLGAPLLFITAQLMLGRPVLWLPRLITQRSVARADFARLVDRMVPWLAKAERLLRPRLSLLIGPVQDRFIGAACLLLAVILFLPIPLGNIVPALAISAFAIGLVERDGIAVSVGWAVSAGALAILVAVSAALWAALRAFLETLFGVTI